MTLLVARSWDKAVNHAADIDAWNLRNGFNSSNGCTLDSSEKRTGIASCRVGNSGHFNWTSPAEQDTLCPHFGYFNDGGVSEVDTLFNCRHNTGSGFTTHIEVERNSLDGIVVKNGDGTTIATSANSVMLLQNWNFFGVEVKVSNTVGYVTIYLNGAAVITTDSLQDTQNGGSAFFNDIHFPDDVRNFYIDDFFVFDTNGSRNNTVLTGEAQCDLSLPEADGDIGQWTPQGAGDDYVEIDDAIIDDDTTYLETDTAGNQFLVEMQALPASRKTVLGMQVGGQARRTAGGSGNLILLNKSGTTTSQGASQTVPSTYTGIWETYEDDPDTSSQWTVSNYNAHQAGGELG